MQRFSGWLTSLHFRLIVGFTLVLVVSLLGVSLYVRYATEREIERYQQEVERARAERIQRVVNQYYENNKDLSGIGPTLEQAKWLYNWNIEVTDAEGKPIALVSGNKPAFEMADNRYAPAYAKFENPPPGPAARKQAGEGRRFGKHIYKVQDHDKKDVASIEMGPADLPGSVPEPPVTRLLATLDASLMWTGIAAGIVGIALVSLLSRRALLSIGVLRGAARTLGGGQYSHRVPKLGPHEIGELGETFNSMADDIQRAERQRLNLMADVAHELRTPLSNIQGYVEAMKDGIIEPSDETLESVHQQVLQLNHLVEDVKLLSLLDAGALRLNFEQAAIGDVLDRSARGFMAKAQAKNVGLTVEADPAGTGLALWHALAVGDSCLFMVREGRLAVSFPLQRPSEFDSTPDLVCSNPAGAATWAGVRLCGGRCEPGDTFILASDALACWFLESAAGGGMPWEDIAGLDPAGWEAWVGERRSAGLMRNDDTTLVVLGIEAV